VDNVDTEHLLNDRKNYTMEAKYLRTNNLYVRTHTLDAMRTDHTRRLQGRRLRHERPSARVNKYTTDKTFVNILKRLNLQLNSITCCRLI